MLFGNAGPRPQAPAPSGQAFSGPATPAGPAIFEAGMADFESRVLLASMQMPVLAYFTAPWCGPCKQLGPLLEASVKATGGAVAMAKINVDNNQELAAALRVQSVPTVFAFFQGRPVDAFQGALPESQVKAFMAKLTQLARQQAPGAIDIPETLKGAAEALAQGDLGTAQALYGAVLQQDERNMQAYAGMVRVFIAAGQLEQAQALLQSIPADLQKNAAYEEAKTAIDLALSKPAAPSAALAAAVAQNPADHQARLDLALALFAEGKRAEAIDALLESIRLNRGWNEEAARKQLVKFFEAMGHADPLTVEARKKLSSILFS